MVLDEVLEEDRWLLDQRLVGGDAAERCKRRVERRLSQREPRERRDGRAICAEQIRGDVDVALEGRLPEGRHDPGYSASRSNVARCSSVKRLANSRFFALRAPAVPASREPSIRTSSSSSP